MILNLFKQRKKKEIINQHSDFLFKKLNKNSLAVDCGANVGVITEKMAEKGAMVYAFEPNPYAFEKLNEKFKDNKKVICFQKGVGIENSKMKLFLHENSDEDEVYWSTGSSFLGFKGNVREDKFIEIDVINLIEFIKSLDKKIDILKIDVEGMECEIIPEIIDQKIYKKIGLILVETHEHKIPELKEKTATIKKLIKEKSIKNINLSWV